jgi:hypothetical protein
MPINRDEIIEELEGQIRKCGGAWGDWCVGTAKDSRGPFFQRHREADLGDGLTYREAFTTTAAQAVVTHFINGRGLQPDREAIQEHEGRTEIVAPGLSPARADLKVGATHGAERGSALHGAPEPGRLVFIYRNPPSTPAPSASDHAAFPRRAA